MTTKAVARRDLDVAYVLAQDTLQLCRDVLTVEGDIHPMYTIVKLREILGMLETSTETAVETVEPEGVDD